MARAIAASSQDPKAGQGGRGRRCGWRRFRLGGELEFHRCSFNHGGDMVSKA